MLLVLPKGRLLKEIKILLQNIGISFDDSSRKLVMDTSIRNLKVAILRSWDIPKFVNKGIAKFKDMKNLIEYVSKNVFEKTGIKLETEIKILE